MKIYWIRAQAPRRVLALAKHLGVDAELVEINLMGGGPQYRALDRWTDAHSSLGRSVAGRSGGRMTVVERRHRQCREVENEAVRICSHAFAAGALGLKELDADFEFVPVNLLAGEHKRPEFLRLNPAGKIPVLVDGDLVIPESAAIVFYLADKYPDKGLLPAGLAQRAQAYRWVMFAVTELEQPLWRITKNTVLYPEDKRLPADIALAKEEFNAMATVLELHLEGRQFIVGDRVTVADCVTAYLIDWANELKLIEAFPQLRAYLARMYARPTAPQRIADAFAAVRAA
jgi:glutathione S-transferase